MIYNIFFKSFYKDLPKISISVLVPNSGVSRGARGARAPGATFRGRKIRKEKKKKKKKKKEKKEKKRKEKNIYIPTHTGVNIKESRTISHILAQNCCYFCI